MGTDERPGPGAPPARQDGASDPAARREERRRERRAAEERVRQQGTWVDLQIQQAMARGDFDRLPGQGKPLELSDRHDPDWWVKRLVERERITGVLPPALQLRRTDAELDGRLDRLGGEQQVREAVEEFNAAVRAALYSTWDGPPVVTAQRDVDAEVRRWRARREERRAAHRASVAAAEEAAAVARAERRGFLARWRRR